MTGILASALHAGGAMIHSGRLSLTVCDEHGSPIPFRSGEDVYGLEPFVAAIVDGAVVGSFDVPDLATVVPLQPHASPTYTVAVLDVTSRQGWHINGVTEVTGPTWSLDDYTPAATAVLTQAVFSSGTGLPRPHSSLDPAIYLRRDTQQLYACFAGTWVNIGPSQSGGGSSSNVISGAFVESVSQFMAVAVLANGYGLAVSSDPNKPAIGIASVGVIAPAAGSATVSGEIENLNWNWLLNRPVFVGPTGTLTQSVPNSGYAQVVGIPTSHTSMLVQIGQPISLN